MGVFVLSHVDVTFQKAAEVGEFLTPGDNACDGRLGYGHFLCQVQLTEPAQQADEKLSGCECLPTHARHTQVRAGPAGKGKSFWCSYHFEKR